MITADVLRIARKHADQDRETLARLIREGKVRRDAALGRNVQGAAAFRADIEARVRPPVNTAIRPKKRRRR